jgi:hypothetical protein|tara:strand:- start:1680 stop:2294 length:615 start_codon:yes stop_codon:yes gene_type:complete
MGTPTQLRKERSVLTGTSFADNTTGTITAQMVRQFVESGMGGYACIVAKAGTPASQAVASGATATIDWNKNGAGADAVDDTATVSATLVGADADFANDRIRIYDKGFFMVSLGVSFAMTGTDTVVWTFRIATQADGGSVVYPGFDAAVQRTTATLDNMASANGIINTTGHTSYTDLLAQVKNGHGSNSENFQMHYGQMSVFRVG